MLFFVFVSWGLHGFIRENKSAPPGSEERRACAAQRASRAARALRARFGGWGAAGMGEGVLEMPASPEPLSDPSGAFFDLFCSLWGVVVGTSTRQKSSLEIPEGPFSVPGTF